MENKNRPVFEARLKGIRLALFENETDGRRWYSASPSRRWVDAATKEPSYATTFNGAADLILLRELIDRAVDWMSRQSEQAEEE